MLDKSIDSNDPKTEITAESGNLAPEKTSSDETELLSAESDGEKNAANGLVRTTQQAQTR
jgi:hypothetical protein